MALVIGLFVGLAGFDDLLPGATVLAVGSGLAALLAGDRRVLIASALLSIAAGGTVIGLWVEARARLDCRHRWRAGDEVRIRGIAIGYLPIGESGSVRIQPLAVPIGRTCHWAGPVRLWTEGLVRPGGIYEVIGAWQPARRPGRGPRPPERDGWVVATGVNFRANAALRTHPFLAARGWLAEKLWSVYPRRWAPLAQALVLGQRETLSREVSQRIARAGLAHLLAISGLHVGMLAAALFALARAARIAPRGSRVLTLILTFAYVLLIGAPASAVRAALMVSLWTLTRLAGRASAAFDVLGLAAIILLLVRPWSVVEPGFQLSFAGAAAVGYAHAEASRSSWLRGSRALPRALVLSPLTSAAAVLLTAPVTATQFGRVVPAAIVGNLAAIPLLALAMPALFLSALLAPWPVLAGWPAAAAVVLLQAIDWVARLLSSVRWASLEVASPGLLPMLAYVVVLVLAAHALHGAWQRRRLILTLGVLSAAVILWPPLKARFAPDHLGVYVLDVGQGDAIAISTPRQHWLLVDAGPKLRDFDAGKRRVLPFLREHGARRLEAWMASHPDLDHVGGAPAILNALDVRRVIGSGAVTGQMGQIAVLQELAESSIPWLRARAGSRLSVDDVELVFLYPDAGSRWDAAGAPNDLSLVFLLEYGEFRMLFTGDVSGAVEDRLGRELGQDLDVQILKVSHHGSASSTSDYFLRTVRPELAVISVGRGNRYGHPSPRVLWRLSHRHVPLRRTDRDGTVVIEAKRDGSWRVSSAAEGY